MALPFRRCRRAGSSGADATPVCSSASPEQRLWEVQALLCTLSPQVQKALFAWLLLPTDLRRWQPPARFSHRRAPISDADLGDDDLLTGSLRLLREELSAIRQTLDFPPEALSGLTRNGLLTMHAVRLRQVESWLWPGQAAHAIRQMIA